MDAPGVGANLQDHLVAGLAPAAHSGTLHDAEKPAEVVRYLTKRKGMLTSNVAEAYGFVRTEVADRVGAPEGLPDIEIIFAPVPYVGEGLIPTPAHGLTIGAILLRPRSRGTIRLASADPAAPPLIDPALPVGSRRRGRRDDARRTRRVRAPHRHRRAARRHDRRLGAASRAATA